MITGRAFSFILKDNLSLVTILSFTHGHILKSVGAINRNIFAYAIYLNGNIDKHHFGVIKSSLNVDCDSI